LEDYKREKAGIDVDLGRWENLRAVIVEQTAQARMNEAAQNERTALAKEVAGSDRLTAVLTEKLIDRVYVHPDGCLTYGWRDKKVTRRRHTQPPG